MPRGPEPDAQKRKQRLWNSETWTQLQKHGVTSATLLTPDANFWASSPAIAEVLASHLERQLGYTVSADTSRRRLLQRKRLWSVVATTPPRTLDLDAINAWTDEMVDVAVDHNAVFEGWGTAVPE